MFIIMLIIIFIIHWIIIPIIISMCLMINHPKPIMISHPPNPFPKPGVASRRVSTGAARRSAKCRISSPQPTARCPRAMTTRPLPRSQAARSSLATFLGVGWRFWNQQINCNRRKFRSKKSDNMHSWKSRGGKSQRDEDKKWKDQRRERVRRKKMQVREKVGRSRFTAFFQWFVALEGGKLGLLKRRVRSHVVRWEKKNCTPVWREEHFQVQMNKAHHSRNTFWSWDVEQVHAVVARRTFPSQKCQTLTVSDHFFTFKCQKCAKYEGLVAVSTTTTSTLHKTTRQ